MSYAAGDDGIKVTKEGTIMATDPICNMEIDETRSKFSSEYAGKTYYFCSQECKNKFDNKPEQYAKSVA